MKKLLLLLLCVPLMFSCGDNKKDRADDALNATKAAVEEGRLKKTEMVKVNQPLATEVKKMEKKSLVSYIYIGKVEKEPTYYIILSDSKIVSLNDAKYKYDSRDKKLKEHIHNFIINQRESIDESQIPYMTTSIKCDEDVPMGIITDVKNALRALDALKINYSTIKE
jgi:hypothetical protein